MRSLLRTGGTALLLIVVVAFGVRVALVVATPGFAPIKDALHYHEMARTLADGRGFGATLIATPGSPTAIRPPTYPSLVGVLYAVTGPTLTGARVLGALLGTLVVVLLYALAAPLAGRRAALVAAGIAALFPPLVLLNGTLLSEALFVPLMLAAVLAGLAAYRRPDRLRLALLAGALCAIAALTRSSGLALIPAVALLVASAPGPWRRRLTGAGAVVLAAAVLFVPWTVRNAADLGAFVPVSTQGGVNAAGVYNSESARAGSGFAVWRPPWEVAELRPLFFGPLGEPGLDRRLTSYARDFAVENPRYVAEVAGLNTLRLLADAGPGHTRVSNTWYEEEAVSPTLRRVSTAAVRLLVLAVVLTLLAWAAGRVAALRPPWALWLVPLLILAGTIPFHGGNRYSTPLAPFLILIAASGLVAGWHRVLGSPSAAYKRT